VVNLFSYSLYLVVNPDLCISDPLKVAEAGIKNGVDIVQLRYKGDDTLFFHQLAGQFRQLTSELGVPFIINDRVDICLLVDADGVHLGQHDVPVEAVRSLLGEEKIIGLSTHNLQQAEQAHQRPVDYIGLGPVFPTNSKKNHEADLGLDGLRDILPVIDLPCFVIGGISTDNVEKVIETGANRVAVISAITQADDPAHATRLLRFAVF